MGQCCSAPSAVVDIRARVDSQGHSQDPGDDMVHVLAAVRASPQFSTPQHSSRLYHHNHSSSSSRRQARNPLPPVPLQELAATQGRPQHSTAGKASTGQLQHLHSAPSPRSWQEAHALVDLQPAHHSIDLAQPHSTSSITSMRSSSTSPSMVAPALKHGQAQPPSDALQPLQVVSVCAAVVQEHAAIRAAGITPLMLASLCLIESGGCPLATHYKEHLGDNAHGLCQMLLPTAQWLASSQGFDRCGKTLTVQDLQNPKTCVYLAGAYLSVLSDHDGSSHSEGWVVSAYHAGCKAVDSAAACSYLQKFLKAKHWLTEVARAMAVTVAASALAAGVQLPAAAEAEAAAAAAEPAAVVCADGGAKVPLPTAADSRDQPSKDQDSGNTCDADADTGADTGGSKHTCWQTSTTNSSSLGSDRGCSSKQVLIRAAAAGVVSALCCTWAATSQAAGAAAPQAAAAAGGIGAGSILAHMLPSRWGLSSSRQPQQGPTVQLSSIPSSASTSADAGASGLVPVAAADLRTAWQRVLCISPAVAEAAAAHAAAAAALAPLQSSEDSQQAAAESPPAAGARELVESKSGSSSSTTADVPPRSTAAPAGHGSAAAHPAATAPTAAGVSPRALDSMPCIMHVVGHGETLQQVANVCNISLPELLAANPDVTSADAVHHNDCIAVPVPAVFPRLVVAQYGDTLHSIARAHDVPLGRLLAKNPELLDPTRLQPGWVVALPGLKGDSRVPLDWLTQAAVSADLQQPEGRAGHSTCLAGGRRDRLVAAGREQQQQLQQGVGAAEEQLQKNLQQPGRQQGAVASKRRPSANSQQPLAALGSGTFLFTVGGGSSSSGGGGDGRSSGSHSSNQQPQVQMQVGAGQQPAGRDRAPEARTGGRRGFAASRSLDMGAGRWTVGVGARPVHD